MPKFQKKRFPRTTMAATRTQSKGELIPIIVDEVVVALSDTAGALAAALAFAASAAT